MSDKKKYETGDIFLHRNKDNKHSLMFLQINGNLCNEAENIGNNQQCNAKYDPKMSTFTGLSFADISGDVVTEVMTKNESNEN